MHYISMLLIFAYMNIFAASSSPLTFALTPEGTRITDEKISSLMSTYVRQSNFELYGALQPLGENGLKVYCENTASCVEEAEKRLQEINALASVTGRRSMVLNFIKQQRSLSVRSTTWQSYHIAAIDELNRILTLHISNIITEPSDLHITHKGADLSLQPQQIDCLQTHVVAYALLISECDRLDKQSFDDIFSHYCQGAQPPKTSHGSSCCLLQ